MQSAAGQIAVPLAAFESSVTFSHETAPVTLEAKNLFPSLFRMAVTRMKEVRGVT